MNTRPTYTLWLDQSESDARSMRVLITTRNFAQACFFAHQTAEKALKALALVWGTDAPESSSLTELVRELKISGELLKFASRLNLYYLTARYPDAWAKGIVPSEQFTADMAAEAQRMATSFVDAIEAELRS